jgi:hypothetical protein
MKKSIAILLAVGFVFALTATAVSASRDGNIRTTTTSHAELNTYQSNVNAVTGDVNAQNSIEAGRGDSNTGVVGSASTGGEFVNAAATTNYQTRVNTRTDSGN